ncbi:uncharacterized protein LOC125855940 [Solanum stenotomum]|uniref:uncharacterized protein LOC125855940 n=1 Tax=Solanum stenotomum TaxID=172797 RepID=UPI0020D179C1|nr:uncharacterized protein LOC125855940 [Solanum stenotomum]
MVASRVRDFTRMNPPEFHGSKVVEDSQEFIDEVYKVLMIMGVTPVEKAELAAYQLKCVAQVWFFPFEMREGKVLVFINLRQGSSSNAPPKFNKDWVSNSRPQGGNGSGSSLPMSTCTKCGRKHEGKCLADTDGCFGCGKSGHKMRDCLMLTGKGREGKQDPISGLNSNAPKQNWFYAVQTQGEQ